MFRACLPAGWAGCWRVLYISERVIEAGLKTQSVMNQAVETSPLHMKLFAEGTFVGVGVGVGVDFFTPCVHVILG